MTKLRIFNSNVKSVLLYTCESWLVSKQVTNVLQTFVNRCLRRILKIYWPAVISNQQLWQTTKQEPTELEIKRRKWKWLGHILRRTQTAINRAALEWNPQGSRRKGRPTNTWQRTVLNEAKSNGLTWNQVKTVAQNRVRWKCVVNALCSRRNYRTYMYVCVCVCIYIYIYIYILRRGLGLLSHYSARLWTGLQGDRGSIPGRQRIFL
jgi:hypothetical protein